MTPISCTFEWWCQEVVILASHWKRQFRCHWAVGWSLGSFRHGQSRLCWQRRQVHLGLARNRQGQIPEVGCDVQDANTITSPALISVKASLTRMTPLLATGCCASVVSLFVGRSWARLGRGREVAALSASLSDGCELEGSDPPKQPHPQNFLWGQRAVTARYWPQSFNAP